MRIIIFCFMFSSAFLSNVHAAWFNSDWQYRKQITIDDAMVPNSDQVNFPVLIYRATDTDLRDNAQTDGSDIVVTDSDETTQLSHEIEFYDNTNGNLVLWVKVPTLKSQDDSASNTILYMYYGDQDHATNGDQENINDVWTNGFQAVLHLDESPANGVAGHLDSTGNGNTGTPNGFAGVAGSTTDGTGRLDGADEFDGSNDIIVLSDGASLDAITGVGVARSWSYWLNITAQGVNKLITDKSPFFGRHLWSELQTNQIYGGVDGNANRVESSVLATGTWYHVVITYDGVNQSLYIDGDLDDGPNAAAGLADDNNDFNIAKNPSGTAHSVNAVIDEFRITSAHRDANWIKTTHNNQSDYFAGVPSDYVTLGAETQDATASTTTLVNSSAISTSTYRLGSQSTGKIYVSIVDNDENTNSLAQETISVTISSNLTGDSETVTLTETGVDTGIFNNVSTGLTLSGDGHASSSNGTLETRANATITASYTDDDDGTDTSSDTATINQIDKTFSLNLDMEGGLASRGDILQGTLTITNNTADIIENTQVLLNLPRGLEYIPNSYSHSEDISISSVSTTNRVTTFIVSSISGNNVVTISFEIIIGSGVVEGEQYEIQMHTEN